MPALNATVKIFDPALPFKTFHSAHTGLDTWHRFVLIKASLRKELLHLPTIGEESLNVSGGMSIKVPKIEIGLQIGSIRIGRAEALVVDEGDYDMLIGSDVLGQIFDFGNHGAVHDGSPTEVRVSSARKDDPTSLSVELFPVQLLIEIKQFEYILRYIRQLYNVLFIVSNDHSFPVRSLDGAVFADELIAPGARLQLAWIDSGSIWLTLKGSLKVLRSLASLFRFAADAKLEQQLAEAEDAKEKFAIDRATREATIREIIADKEKLANDHREATYSQWLEHTLKNINIFNDLIAQVSDPAKAERLKILKDDAITHIVEQQLLPVVRNYPLPFDPNETQLKLPPSSQSDI
jgi:hypothetical protein